MRPCSDGSKHQALAPSTYIWSVDEHICGQESSREFDVCIAFGVNAALEN